MKSSRESDKPITRIGKNVRNNDKIVDDRAVAFSSSGQNRSEAFDTDSNSPSPIATKKRDFTGASIGIARDDNYSEEDSMSCTNCTDYSEDDISMKELDQLTHIGKFLAGMRQQHTTGGRESVAIAEGKVQHYNKRRGSEDELRRRRENDERKFKRENESSRSKFEYGRDRVTTNKDKSIEGDMRGFVSLEGHVTRCEITKSLNETSSSSYKYIVERRISRSNSEQEKGLLRSYSHQSHGREDKEKLNFDKEEFLGIGRNELVLQRNLSHCKPILEPIHCAHSNTTSPTRFSDYTFI